LPNNGYKLITNVYILYTFGFVILLVGFISEIFFANNFFQRSGSLLVIFALALVAVRAELERKRILTSIAKDKSNPFSIKHAYEHQQYKNTYGEKVADNILQSKKEVFETMSQRYESEVNLVNNITTAEILIAGTGTFVWGFGDLIAKVILNNCPHPRVC